mgnify:FL=1
MSYLHVQNRSVPTVENVDCGVQVRVLSEPARGTDKRRLALATSTVHCPTGRAGLRGVGRVDFLEVERLIGQHRFNLVPADIEDGAVQTALLSHPFQLSPFSHVLSAQALNDDSAILSCDLGRAPVHPVLANTGLLGFYFGRTLNGFAMTFAAAFSAGRYALKPFVLLVQPSNAFGQTVASPVRQHQGDGNATINTDRAAHIFNVSVNQATDADLPAKAGARDCRFANAALNRSGATKLDPPQLGQLDARPLGIQFLDADVAPHKTEAIPNTGFFELGETALPLEKPHEGRVQIFHRPLLTLLTNGFNKVKLGAQVFKLAGLRNVVEVITRSTLILPPVVYALLKGKVPYEATHSGKFQHGLMLFTRGFKPICETAKNHIKQMGVSYA